MIIIGYQGIGKSTYCHNNRDAIDFESSNFRKDDGTRPEEWYNIYAKAALELSSDGFIVFTSSHAEVREALKKYNQSLYNNSQVIIAVCPAIELRDKWIERLHSRYLSDPSRKNHAAWKNAEEYYEDNIKGIAKSIEKTYYITTIDYDCFRYFDNCVSCFA